MSELIKKNSYSSTKILADLRELMSNDQDMIKPIQAYIVPNSDAHMSEYLAGSDQRLRFVTGFTGSAGTAVVTLNEALLWTDPRYFIQATKEMDENWTLMKMGVAGTPTEEEWLAKNLPKGSSVGADPKLVAYPTWVSMKTKLEKHNIELLPITRNLINIIWRDRPAPPTANIHPLPENITGMSSYQKVRDVRAKMKENEVDVLVISSLDDIAWFLNLRGNDIAYNPVFFSYIVLSLSHVHLFIDQTKVTLPLRNHFNKEDVPVTLHPYDHVYGFLTKMVEEDTSRDRKVWIGNATNYYIYSKLPEKTRFCEANPICFMKSIKNKTEIEGMTNAHIKDGVALSRFYHWLETEMNNTRTVTEISAAKKLEEFKKAEEGYVGPSFATISASGPNAAITHYNPTPATDRILSTDEIYLCDSGSQFIDGTTDVTRTIHLGEPDEFMKECYTRVYKGLCSLSSCVFPNKLKGNCLDTFARRSLWEVGLDYGHGTGHGVGHYLYVHEGPMGISWRPYPDDPGLQENMFLSNEPGFYMEGKFGIRIENIVQVKPAVTTHNYQDKGFLRFDTVTLCPIQKKMLITSMLNEQEIMFLNNYHSKVYEVLSPILKKRNLTDVHDWLVNETKPIE